MDKTRRKRIKRYTAWGLLAVLVALLAAMPLMAANNAGDDGPVATIKSGTVETGSITNALGGGGTLAEDKAVNITIPTGVKLTEFLVENDEVVSQGDALAAVDKVSVMTAITEVQDTLDYLDDEIEAADSQSGSNTLSAQTEGKVKLIYARAGDDVRDVILKHGALAVLSLDGRMALDVETDASLRVGDSVLVTLEEDEKVTGRVDSTLGDTVIITIPDDGYEVDATARVSSEDGDYLGYGRLYIHNPWNATAYYGTVSSVDVKENDTVYIGQTLMTLEDTDHSSQFEILLGQRREYEEVMLELFQMYQAGVVTAPCDGIVAGVDEDSAYLLSGDNGGWVIQLLGNVDENPEEPDDPDNNEGSGSEGSGNEGGDEGSGSEGGGSEGSGNEGGGDEGSGSEGNENDNNDVDPDEPDKPDDPGDTPVTYHYFGKILENGTLLVDYSTYYPDVSNDMAAALRYNEEKMITPAVLPTTITNLSGEKTMATVGDILLFASTQEMGAFVSGVIVKDVEGETVGTPGGDADDMSGMGDMEEMAGMIDMAGMSGMSGMGGISGGTIPEPAFEPYDLTENTILSVTPKDAMTLDITVDELDIGKVAVGQPVDITIPALTEEAVTGTVTQIGTAENSGGNSKFTVTITLDRGENMLSGMSASAAMVQGTAENVLTIPVAALVDDGTEVFVYTSYDAETETLGDPVAVTLGASDGENVQILSGLKAGQTYYYAYYDAPETQ